MQGLCCTPFLLLLLTLLGQQEYETKKAKERWLIWNYAQVQRCQWYQDQIHLWRSRMKGGKKDQQISFIILIQAILLWSIGQVLLAGKLMGSVCRRSAQTPTSDNNNLSLPFCLLATSYSASEPSSPMLVYEHKHHGMIQTQDHLTAGLAPSTHLFLKVSAAFAMVIITNLTFKLSCAGHGYSRRNCRLLHPLDWEIAYGLPDVLSLS